MGKIEDSLKQQAKRPKYRFASHCPICNNEGGVHGKCLGCGEEGNWNYVLGDEALQEKIKENKGDKCNLGQSPVDDKSEVMKKIADLYADMTRDAAREARRNAPPGTVEYVNPYAISEEERKKYFTSISLDDDDDDDWREEPPID